MRRLGVVHLTRNQIRTASLWRNWSPVSRTSSHIFSLGQQQDFQGFSSWGYQDVEHSAHRILQVPVGSISDKDWKVVEGVFGKVKGNKRAVCLSFQLLDRLVEEAKATDSADDWSHHTLDQFLHSTIYNWRNEFVNSLEKDTMLLPSQVVNKIQDWREAINLQGDTQTYTMILEAAANMTEDPNEGVLFAQSLLEWMIEESQVRNHFHVRPTTLSVALVMKAWADSGRPEALARVQEWMDCLLSHHEQGWSDMQPNVVVYNTLLHALAQAGEVEQAENVLQSMLRNENNVYPDSISFSTLLLGYTKLKTPDGMNRAETLLTQMQDLSQGGMASVKPNVMSWTTVVNGYADMGLIEPAERLLNDLERKYLETADMDWKLDTAIYNAVMKACANALKPSRAEDWLDYLYEKGLVQPDDNSYHAVLSAYAKAGQPDRAETVLNRMHESFACGELDMGPVVLSYNLVLDSWAKSKHPQAWKRALDILHHMMELHEGGNEDVQPNIRTWNTVLHCFASVGQREFHRAVKFMEEFRRASQEGRVVGKPTVRSWNTLLACCMGNTKDDFRVKQIWELMKEDGVQPDIVSYNTVFSCYARYNQQKGRSTENMEVFLAELRNNGEVELNRVSYLSLINAWVGARKLEKAEELLKSMCMEHASDGAVEPDRGLFHKVLVAWARASKPRRVESLLLLMSELDENHGFACLKPTVETYNILLNAWAGSREREAGDRADLILRQMERALDDDVSPDVISYNTVLKAWANSGDPIALTKVEHLILEMILKGNPNLTPTEVSYGLWLNCIASSNENDKHRRAKEVLKTMRIHKFKPTDSILEIVGRLQNS